MAAAATACLRSPKPQLLPSPPWFLVESRGLAARLRPAGPHTAKVALARLAFISRAATGRKLHCQELELDPSLFGRSCKC